MALKGEEDDFAYMDSMEIILRQVFPDSWMMLDIKLPGCPTENPNW